MSTRDIRTSVVDTSCDVCGRTLLRGERAETFLDGATRRSVCELCTARAVQEGWIREGTMPAYQTGDTRSDRRRSLLNRWRSRRDAAGPARAGSDDDYEPRPPGPASSPAPAGPFHAGAARRREHTREPRHVRAVPTSVEHKVASAVDAFNASEHPSTVASVARSLGIPTVAIQPAAQPSVVDVVVSWELCWYRYEVDLSEDVSSVRVGASGYELDELQPEQLRANATADEHGRLALG